MNNLVREVTYKEFDTELIKKGQLITYCKTYKSGDGIRDGGAINGIIRSVSADRIIIFNSNGEPASITVKHLEDGERRILGIMDNAINETADEPIEENL